jgi:uncharacterized protein
MKVFVTGGTGMVGWGVLHALKEAGHDVVSVTHRDAGIAELEKRGAKGVKGDVSDAASLAPHVKDAEAVIHLAEAFPQGARMNAARVQTLADVDSAALKGLMAAMTPKTRAFIYTSGAFIYGDCSAPVTESAPLRPHSLVVFKAKNDELVLQAARAGTVPGMTARLGMVYGPLGKFMDNVLKNPLKKKKGMALPPGAQLASMIHAYDVGRAYVKMIEAPRPGEAYNIGDTRPVSSMEAATKVAELCGAPKPSLAPGFIIKLVLGQLAEPLMSGHPLNSDKVREHFKLDWLYPTIDQGFPATIEQARAL